MSAEKINRIKLGVNIDHIATLREARRINYPDPVKAAIISEKAGCDSIVAHLRQDRRHIKDSDIFKLKQKVKTRFNLEMSVLEEIVQVALDIVPDQITLVPEKREEITTEGGLDVKVKYERIKQITQRCKKKNIAVSLFIDPDNQQVKYSKETGAEAVEFHTGIYVNAFNEDEKKRQLKSLITSCEYAHSLGLRVYAGHGLNYTNVTPITKLPYLEELNIGHSIVSMSVFTGIEQAVKQMLKLLSKNEHI